MVSKVWGRTDLNSFRVKAIVREDCGTSERWFVQAALGGQENGTVIESFAQLGIYGN